jgi:hypothetical protein
MRYRGELIMAKALMRKDLTETRFGKLVALYVDEERSCEGKVYWWCKCDCGNLKSIQSTSLTRKKRGVISCGCARNSKEAQDKAKITRESYPKDIVGLRFGRLIVLRKTNIKSHKAADNGAYLWECLCDCGELCYYSRYSLITPNGVKSCGCLYHDSRSETNKKYCEYDLETYIFGVGYCNNGTHFFFDKEDYDKIKDYCWWYDGRYVCAHSLEKDQYTTKILRLHRVVMNIEDREDIDIDHKNLVRYDCRKTNLRRATTSENSRNKDYSYMASKTGIVGVKMENNKYVAHISIDGKSVRLGLFDTIEEAAEARLEAELEYFGEFRYNLDDKDIINEDDLSQYIADKTA